MKKLIDKIIGKTPQTELQRTVAGIIETMAEAGLESVVFSAIVRVDQTGVWIKTFTHTDGRSAGVMLNVLAKQVPDVR